MQILKFFGHIKTIKVLKLTKRLPSYRQETLQCLAKVNAVIKIWTHLERK